MDHTFSHTAVKNGNWSDPTVWNTGTVPGDLATVNYAGFTVVYDVNSDVRIVNLHSGGTGVMKWATTRTKLVVDSIMAHGYFELGTWDNPIPDSGELAADGTRIPQAEIVFWAHEAPGTGAGLGLMTMAAVRMCGAPKRMHTSAAVAAPRVDATIPAGALGVTLVDAPDGWQIGDQILIQATEHAGTSDTDPQYSGPTSYFDWWGRRNSTERGFMLSQDEVRTITGISGNKITWDVPLEFDHKQYVDTLPDGTSVDVRPAVAMFTHSVRLRSADASDPANLNGDLSDLQKRAHTMFMHSDDVQARYIEGKNLARTDTNPSLSSDQNRDDNNYSINDKIFTDATRVEIRDPNNVKGRYAWHTHGGGAHLWRKQVVFDGLTAWAPKDAPPMPGWAITHHNSRATIENCVVYNFRGAGLVSENGNEIGQWLDNVISWGRGDGYETRWGDRTERVENHNGHQGVAMENQARQILLRGNRMSSCHYFNYYMQQAPRTEYPGGEKRTQKLMKRVPDEYSIRFRDPLVRGANDNGYFIDYGVDYPTAYGSYGVEQAQIPPLEDNIAFAGGDGFFVSHRSHTNRNDHTPMVMRRNHMINVHRPINIAEYSFHYGYYDMLCIGGAPGTYGTALFNFGTIEWQHFGGNIKAIRYDRVFRDTNTGMMMNFNGGWFDIELEDVPTVGVPMSCWIDTTPEGHPLYNCMGDWQVIEGPTAQGRYRVRPDTWEIWDKATQLPLDKKGVNLPRGNYGVTAPEPLPGTPRPYVHITNPSLSNLQGIIADGMGLRELGAYQIMYDTGQVVARNKYRRQKQFMTDDECAMRNGCFSEDGGTTWKSRLWFIDVDRATGELFSWSHDAVLNGLTDQAKTTYGGIIATAPDLTMPAEKPSFDPYVPDTSTPAIATGDISISNGDPLLHKLQVNRIYGNWTFTGPDADDVEVTMVSGHPHMQWAGGGTKLFDSPTDADADNIYTLDAVFTDPLGNIGSKTINVTVLEGLADYFFNFSVDGNLSDQTYWSLESGDAIGLTTSNGWLSQSGATCKVAGPSLRRALGIACEVQFGSQAGSSFYVIEGNTAGEVKFNYHWSSTLHLRAYDRIADISTFWQFPNPLNKLVRVEIQTDGTIAVYYDNTLQVPTSNGAALAQHCAFLAEDGTGYAAIEAIGSFGSRVNMADSARWFVL